MKQMRWKTLFFENESESTFNYGFNTREYPLQRKDLMEFEDDLQKIISSVQFRRVKNDFQNRRKNDIRSIQSSKNNLITTFTTVLIWKQNMLQKKLIKQPHLIISKT